ncbi:polysaccharide biosynthesis/export family protein [Granulicella sp. dw_53]|uniref:polysaccharide biosynthesis/export family protein n=1 Tax=Granulicella sp. dw_53 TaxID=2719792 RepID=UPI001BD40D3E|nr:polysaccharide biosynthesis/export family protein [Granulicella sp. dw_53]
MNKFGRWYSAGSLLLTLELCLSVVPGGLWAQATGVSQPTETSPQTSTGTPEQELRNLNQTDTKIEPGDLLTILVFDTPEFSGPIRVSNKGSVDLPLIGSLTITGMSPVEAAALIRARLIQGNFLKDPQVSISYADLTNHTVTLLGEISHPGPVPLNGVKTLWDVIGFAGGPTIAAGKKIMIFHRGDNSNPSIFDMSWDKDLTGQPNPVIYPGDTIQVTRAGVVYVVGQVGRQGAYPIARQRMTVAEAIALSGGIPYVAKAAHARLIHRTESGHTVEEIDIPSMLQGKRADVVLHDNDIIFVPLSISKVAITRGIESAIAFSSSFLTYRVAQNNNN